MTSLRCYAACSSCIRLTQSEKEILQQCANLQTFEITELEVVEIASLAQATRAFPYRRQREPK